ncbi:MAG: DUF4258 domain-containing protein [Methanoregulaceae archaeon]
MTPTLFPPYRAIYFRRHALRQMARLHLTDDDIDELLGRGGILEQYPEETGCLVAGTIRGRTLRAVMAHSGRGGEAVVLAVFDPDAGQEIGMEAGA